MEVKVTVDSRQALEVVQRVQSRTSAASMRLFLRTFVQPWLAGRINARFFHEGDTAVGQWQDLTFNTGRIRAFQGFTPFHPINKRTGALQNFLVSSYRVNTIGAAGAMLTIPGSSGSRDIASKIKVAQLGGQAPTSRMGPSRPTPPRPVLALDMIDYAAVTTGLLDWIKGGGIV